MTGTFDHGSVANVSESLSKGVKNRIKFLVLASMLTVALAFGLTFYFALVANESAVARQVPELEGVAAKLKNLLVMNTVAFAALIIASFFVLSSIITSRLFHPLAALHGGLLTLAEGKLPRFLETGERGPFSVLDNAMMAAVSRLREKEQKEIAELDRIAEALAGAGTSPDAVQKLEELAHEKSALIGAVVARGKSAKKKEEEDALFIQP